MARFTLTLSGKNAGEPCVQHIDNDDPGCNYAIVEDHRRKFSLLKTELIDDIVNGRLAQLAFKGPIVIVEAFVDDVQIQPPSPSASDPRQIESFAFELPKTTKKCRSQACLRASDRVHFASQNCSVMLTYEPTIGPETPEADTNAVQVKSSHPVQVKSSHPGDDVQVLSSPVTAEAVRDPDQVLNSGSLVIETGGDDLAETVHHIPHSDDSPTEQKPPRIPNVVEETPVAKRFATPMLDEGLDTDDDAGDDLDLPVLNVGTGQQTASWSFDALVPPEAGEVHAADSLHEPVHATEEYVTDHGVDIMTGEDPNDMHDHSALTSLLDHEIAAARPEPTLQEHDAMEIDKKDHEATGGEIDEDQQAITEAIEQLTEQPVEQLVAEPVEPSIDQSIEEAVEEPVEEPIEQSIREPIEQSVVQGVGQPVEEAVEETVEPLIEAATSVITQSADASAKLAAEDKFAGPKSPALNEASNSCSPSAWTPVNKQSSNEADDTETPVVPASDESLTGVKKRKAIEDISPPGSVSEGPGSTPSSTTANKRVKTTRKTPIKYSKSKATASTSLPQSVPTPTRSSRKATAAYTGPLPRILLSSTTIKNETKPMAFLKKHATIVESLGSDRGSGANMLCIGSGEVKKTAKLLLSLLYEMTIVHDGWIRESLKAGKLLPTAPYIPTELMPTKWISRRELFAGKSVFLTSALKKAYGTGLGDIQIILKLTGGKEISSKAVKSKKGSTDGDEELILIGLDGMTDKEAVSFLQADRPVYKKDFLSQSVLQAELLTEVEDLQLQVGSAS